MNPAVPSRRLLRQLAITCRELAHTYPSRPQLRTICHTRQRQSLILSPASPRAQACKLLPTRHASTSTSTFTNTTGTPEAATSPPPPQTSRYNEPLHALPLNSPPWPTSQRSLLHPSTCPAQRIPPHPIPASPGQTPGRAGALQSPCPVCPD